MEAQNRIRELEEELKELKASCQPQSDTARSLSEGVELAIQVCNDDYNILRQILADLTGNNVEDARAKLHRLLEEGPTIAGHFKHVGDAHNELLEYQKRRTAFHRNRARNLRAERNRATIELAQIHEGAAEMVKDGDNMSIEEARSIIATLEASMADATFEVEKLAQNLQALPDQIDPADTDDQVDIDQDTENIAISKGRRELSVLLGNLNSLVTTFKLTTRPPGQQPQQDIAPLQDKISELEIEIGMNTDEIKDARKDLETCKEHGKILEKEIGELKARLLEAHNNNQQPQNNNNPDYIIKHLRGRVTTAQEVAEQRRKELRKLKWGLHDERAAWTAAMKENKTLEAEIFKLKSEIKELKEFNYNNTVSNTKEQGSLAEENIRLGNVIKHLKRQKEAEQTKLNETEKCFDLLVAQMDQQEEEWKQEKKSLDAEIARLRRQPIGEGGEEIKRLTTKLESLKEERERENRECKQEKQRLEKETGKLELRLQQAIGEHAEEIKRLTTELEDLRKELDRKGNEYGPGRQIDERQIAALQERHAEQIKIKEQEVRELSAKQRELLEQRDGENMECEQEKSRLYAEIQALSAQIDDLRRAREESEVVGELRNTIAVDLRQELEDCRAETWQQRRDRTKHPRPPPGPGPDPDPEPEPEPEKPPRKPKRKREDPALKDLREWEKNGDLDKHLTSGKRRRR
ncbi:uncharacterized protein BP5553_00640 [Venustampulla echinocandica]|uniref:Uncharacterized protein n=1 Tax=Venustampulla echinocandica TaxID=2656787 RepID=A0A370TYS7_9HELO|nr:uncharacterized protein BP5553_00640 [Venustampulla echinocandica]RDL40661.1 hypothetical protein BP5553_00640 [Venustampulla echinocandica]